MSVCKQICLQTPAGRAGGSGACGRRPRRGARAAAAVGPSRTRGAAQRDPADPDCSNPGTDSVLRMVSSSQHGAKGPDRARRLLPRRRPAPWPFRAGGDAGGAGAGPAGGAVLLATPVPSPALAPLLPLGPSLTFSRS